MIRFTLPGHPPSTNNLYVTRGKRRFKSPEFRAWSEEHGWRLLAQRSQRGNQPIPAGASLALAIRLYGSWRTKAGEHRKVDASNRIKALEDLAAEILHFDDRQVYRVSVAKVPAAAERTELDIWPLDEVPF